MANFVRQQHSSQFSRADVDFILKSTFVEQVEFHPTIKSTNDRALELAGDHEKTITLRESCVRAIREVKGE